MAWKDKGALIRQAKKAKMDVRTFVESQIALHGSRLAAANALGVHPNALRWQQKSIEEKRMIQEIQKARREARLADAPPTE